MIIWPTSGTVFNQTYCTLLDTYGLLLLNFLSRIFRNAFDIAEKHLGIPRLLDPEDVDTPRLETVGTLEPKPHGAEIFLL